MIRHLFEAGIIEHWKRKFTIPNLPDIHIFDKGIEYRSYQMSISDLFLWTLVGFGFF